MMTALVREVLKKYRKDFEFLGVGQKATITPIWIIRMFGNEYHVGLFVGRFK